MSVRELCLAGLQRSYDPAAGLWNRQLRGGRWAATRGTEDVTGTCICLIALDRAGVDAAEIGISPERALAAAARRLAEHGYAGGLGLLVWANAVHADSDQVLAAAGRYRGGAGGLAARLTSMEAAWLLSGLVHSYRRRPRAQLHDGAVRVLAELQERFDRAGSDVLPHAGGSAPLAHRLRRSIANFADQVYAVQALSFAAIAFGAAPALDRARRLAVHLVALQGPLGQWWWHYDARSGGVATRYPVYSVHQYGMAPMALLALSRASEIAGEPVDLREAIARSRAWPARNELETDLLDISAGTIWRCVERAEGQWRSRVRHGSALLGLAEHGIGGPALRSDQLRLNRETRPYEWAWHLYADAVAARADARHHLV
jgi:hypothetical protein